MIRGVLTRTGETWAFRAVEYGKVTARGSNYGSRADCVSALLSIGVERHHIIEEPS